MKRTRKLQYETLESRHLLSVVTDWESDWKDVGYAATVFSNGGAALTGTTLLREIALLNQVDDTPWTLDYLRTSSSRRTADKIGGNPSDLNGVLKFPDGQPAIQVGYTAGGKAVRAARAMGAAGRENMKDFVADGGWYTGSCAGMFIWADYSRYTMGVYKGTMRSSRTGSNSVDFSGHAIGQFLADNGIPSMRVANIPQIGGPIVRESYRHPADTIFVGNITGSSVRMRGAKYIVELPLEGGGGIFLQSGHPEYGRRTSHTILMAAQLHYARSQMTRTPNVKGELELGQTVTMAGATEKVGENQYHRYSVNVPEGTTSLTVTLSGLSGEANLYVQREGAAHAGMHGWSSTLVGADAITIDTPTPGVYEVSVHGAHSTANGVAYTLSVGALPAAEGESVDWITVSAPISDPPTRTPDRPAADEPVRDEMFAAMAKEQESPLELRRVLPRAVDAVFGPEFLLTP